MVNGSFVFVETGQQGRDKFMASGQQTAISGTVVVLQHNVRIKSGSKHLGGTKWGGSN